MNSTVTFCGFRPFRIAIALLAMGSAGFSSAQNLVFNGDFENTSAFTLAATTALASQGYYYVPGDGSVGQPIAGWTSQANPLFPSGNTPGVDIITGSFTPHNGLYGIDMAGTSTGSTLGSIQQQIGTSLISGGFYTLSFNFGRFLGTPDPAPGTPFLSVSLVNVATGLTAFSGTVAPNPSAPAGTFTLQTFNFNLAGATGSYYLRFDALREVPVGSDSGAYLDDISLMVPEASTVWMAAITLALVGRFSWKRFRPVPAPVPVA